ncbi:MAG: hypothetical protein ACJAT0_000304 [Nonlabens sp.]|jgi:hypothetical protein|uniref:hypothetical protein n=1 Tax=Nonlabens sp. TaxID=1888209 RepID=UPI0039E2EDC8
MNAANFWNLDSAASMEISMLYFSNCGANQLVEESYKSLHCVYCTLPLMIEEVYQDDRMVLGALAPLDFKQDQACQIFKK